MQIVKRPKIHIITNRKTGLTKTIFDDQFTPEEIKKIIKFYEQHREYSINVDYEYKEIQYE